MTKRNKVLLGCLLVTLVATMGLRVYAGYMHLPGGNTVYDRTQPTPATFWHRQQKGSAEKGTLWPAERVWIFAETPRYYVHEASHTNAVVSHKYAFGFWEQEADGTVWPREDLGEAVADEDSVTFGGWHDVEWELDDSGILWPKE